MTIFFTFSPTSNHIHPLQVDNCDSNSRLLVDGDDNVWSGLKGLRAIFLWGCPQARDCEWGEATGGSY